MVDLRPWLGRASLYEARADGDFFCRLRGSTLCGVPVPGHAADGILVSRTQPRPFAEMGLAHYGAALAASAPAIHRIALEWQGFAYDYERLTLPLAAGGGLPPMVLTFISCSIPRSTRFWERYNAGY